MRMKKSLLLMMMAFALVLSACGANGGGGANGGSGANGGGAEPAATEPAGSIPAAGGNAGSGDAPAEPLYVPLVSKGFQHQFWQAVKQGAETAAAELGVDITFEGPETESQVDKQLEMLQVALDKNPSAIGFAALDSQASIPLLQRAQEAGIPVIAFDSGVDSDIPASLVTTDNVAAAGSAADKMAELIGGEGEVAVIVHDQTSRTGIDRRDGFVNRIEEQYPNIKIVDIQYGGGDHLKSTDLAKAIIQAYPNLKGFFGANEGSAIGIINAVTEMNAQGNITVIGYDSGKAQIDAIRNGLMAGAISQNPVGIGYETVKAAVAAASGESVPALIDSGYVWYDNSNIDSEEVQAVIYE